MCPRLRMGWGQKWTAHRPVKQNGGCTERADGHNRTEPLTGFESCGSIRTLTHIKPGMKSIGTSFNADGERGDR